MTAFDGLLLAAATLAGAVASVTGFGIGSILTPLLALQAGTKLAVAAIAIPHLIATAIRFWIVRAHVNRRALVGFGIASAVGGLVGAFLHSTFQRSHSLRPQQRSGSSSIWLECPSIWLPNLTTFFRSPVGLL